MSSLINNNAEGEAAGSAALTVGDRFAELVSVNGGPRVSGWGMVQIGGGPYGRVGLNQAEALELIFLTGVVEGFVRAGVVTGDEIGREVRERARAVEIRNRLLGSLTPANG